ncbi:hypothetical protein HF086_007686 [Spodoptera exigua]|uniref:C2H2-type domain-containing protein n=1 Tax=Spodoptera exigua TaxID=7107 RepID=A0A922MUR1_SPOEX|nr:hypothetical protein HF086_007686 [Spodoptera exigua]
MSNLKICRICLSTDVKMYEYDQYDLKSYYEQIMATKVNEKHGLPKCFCYQCAALLHKFHKFKEKCYIGQKALREIIWKGPLTKKAVRNIDRESKNILIPLNIITVNKRVRTCVVKTSNKIKLQETKPVEVDVASLSDDGDFGDNTFEDNKEHLLELDIEKIDIKEKKEDFVELEKIEKDKIDDFGIIEPTDTKIQPTENVNFEIEKVFTDDEIQSDNEKVFVDDIKIISEDEDDYEPEEPKKKRTRNTSSSKKKKAKETIPKEKKFAVKTTKKAEMDPNNWLKINLTEEEAEAEFKARGQHKRDLEINAPLTSNPRKRRQNLKRLTRIPTDCHIPGSVSSHLNTHTREKLYTCNTCGRQFSSKGGMTTHQLVSYKRGNRKKKTDELSKDDYVHEDSDDNMTLDNFYARKF